jgi:hydroxyacylglutathione hydrolase
LFPSQSTDHPDERVLQLTKEDVLALPAALRSFNGFYTHAGDFVIVNPIRNLVTVAIGALVILVTFGILLFRFIRRRRRAQT